MAVYTVQLQDALYQKFLMFSLSKVYIKTLA